MVSIPPISWSLDTAKTVLGTSAWVERLGMETVNRSDLGSFRVTAWTDNLALIPLSKQLWLAEPLEFGNGDDDLLVPVEALIPEEVALLEFNFVVHLVRIEDTIASTNRSSAGGSGGDSDEVSGGGGGMGGDLGVGPSARGHQR
jgi:hypothetical protein